MGFGYGRGIGLLLVMVSVVLAGCSGVEPRHGTRVTLESVGGKTLSREQTRELSHYLMLRSSGVLGVARARVDSVTDNSIVLLLPGKKVSAKNVDKLIRGTGLEFFHLKNAATKTHPNRPWRMRVPSGPNGSYVFSGPNALRIDSKADERDVLTVVAGAPKAKPILTGDDVLPNANLVQGTQSNVVAVRFTEDGAKRLREFTRENRGEYLAVFYNGILISAPIIGDPIEGGEAMLTGFRSRADAQAAVSELNAGTIPVPAKITKVEYY